MRIPKEIVREMHFREGSPVSFAIEDGSIIITHTKKPKYTLDGLLKNVNKKQLHGEIFSNSEVGNEVVLWEK
jgi:antitoxin component of MazEF toxin-antitoxin module